MCAICLLSCGENPKGIVEEYYTQIKKRNYEKVAGMAIDYFWKTERLDKEFDKPKGEEERAEMILDMAKLLKKTNVTVRDIELLKISDEDIVRVGINEDNKRDGKTLVKIKFVQENEDGWGDREITEYTYIYTFVKNDGKWIAVDRHTYNIEIL
jgi:hypothetical protein